MISCIPPKQRVCEENNPAKLSPAHLSRIPPIPHRTFPNNTHLHHASNTKYIPVQSAGLPMPGLRPTPLSRYSTFRITRPYRQEQNLHGKAADWTNAQRHTCFEPRIMNSWGFDGDARGDHGALNMLTTRCVLDSLSFSLVIAWSCKYPYRVGDSALLQKFLAGLKN